MRIRWNFISKEGVLIDAISRSYQRDACICVRLSAWVAMWPRCVCSYDACTCAPPAGIKQSQSHCNKYSSRKSFESLFEKYASIIFIPFSEAKFVFIDVEITIFFSLLCRKNEKYRIIIFYRGEKLIKWQFRIVQSYLSRVGCWVMNDRNGTRIEYNFKFIRQRIILRFAVLSFHCERRIDRI